MNNAGDRRTIASTSGVTGPVKMIASTLRLNAARMRSSVRRADTPVSPSMTVVLAPDSSSTIDWIVSLKIESVR